MKKTALLVIIVIIMIFANGCRSKKTSINDFFDFPSESPKIIEVLYDDPNKASSFITDSDDIDMILSILFARSYKEVKTVTPKSNTRIRLIYDDYEVIVSLNGITDSSKKKYEPVSDDGLESLIITTIEKENN